jgi:hypothetical protein
MISIPSLSPAALAAATANLKAALESAIGPVEVFQGMTDEGSCYIGFTQGGWLRLTVEDADGGAAVVTHEAGTNEADVLVMAPTQIEAMERAVALSQN